MGIGAGTMARPKTGKAQPPERGERETVIHMKGSPEYVGWLEAVHKQTHIPKVQIVRLAIAEWAKAHGHPSPPEI
jgi:hypothetical protein